MKGFIQRVHLMCAGVSYDPHFWGGADRPLAASSNMSKPTLTECPVCQGKGDVASRLPFRRKACPECGRTGHVTLGVRQVEIHHVNLSRASTVLRTVNVTLYQMRGSLS